VSYRTDVRQAFERFTTEVGRAHRTRGLIGAVGTTGRLVGRQVRRPLDYGREYALDRKYGLETRGRRKIAAATLDRGEHRDGVDFESTPPPSWRKVLRALPLDNPGDFTFVDLGCGKGFVLALAALHGFGRVVGVELDPDLARQAQANAQVLSERTSRAVDVVEGDATAFDLPTEPSLIYLYNPFGPQTMRDVVRRVDRSLAERPRPLFVAYVNPLHRHVWDESSTLRALAGNRHWAVYGPADGFSGNRESALRGR
jgi:SAM-dependent methyltransferase